MKLKKICICLLKVLLIIFLVLSFNLIMMPKYINENQDGRIIAEMYREKISPDVVFIGSSTVYSGISPVALYEGFGLTSYILASSSQTSWDSYYVLEESLKHFAPKLVVFDIGFLTTEEDYVEEVSNRKLFDYMRPSLNKYRAVNAAMSEEIESISSYAFPVLRYHTRYNDLSFDDFKYAFYKPNVTYNGYIMSLLMSAELPEERSMAEAADFVLNNKNRDYLMRIITLCKDKDIDLLLIKTPSYQAKWGYNFETEINNVAIANNLTYIDFDLYSNDMDINYYTDSPDNGGHLNLLGAEKFSYYLGNILMSSFDIPDRRVDEKYKSIWEEKVTRYEDDKAKKIEELFQ